ncbi:hypothetical protein INT45_008604 [Circinella minor]|uniref:Uncharacterized protein n=1 Tax=Circinella minor TaxID=1195481 RepID=A0A8H7VKF4_9FUNG|nr:hypothetical protein INT45_008604 [Circinella minor]
MSQSLSFAELYVALDPKSIHKANQSKPLCENIFDVPRSDLFETYNRLRQAFWSNEPSIDTTIATLNNNTTTLTNDTTSPFIEQKIATPASPSIPLKRQPSDLEIIPSEVQEQILLNTNTKRRRIDRTDSPKLQQQQQKELFGSAKIPSLYTLWGIKRIIIQQLRCSLPKCDQQCNQEQKQHLKRYIEPILLSTRRQCLSLEEALKRWE